jgi:threonine-phosphate decarboxylase
MILGHGDDGYLYHGNIKANFSSNVFYEGLPEGLREHLLLSLDNITRYPEANAESLQALLAQKHQLSQQQILVTNGATEAFYLIAHHLQKQSATIIIPAFAEYQDACQVHQVPTEFKTWEAVDSTTLFDTQAVFFGNPNNPTGLVFEKEMIVSLLKNNPNTLFVIDEAYVDFTKKNSSIVSAINSFSNLIVVKSLTKTYAIPGLRLGYLISQQQNIQAIQSNKMPWSVNTMAIEAGKYIIQNQKLLALPLARLLADALDLKTNLSRIPNLEIVASHTNFFLCKTNIKTAEVLKHYLLNEHQLLIRDASNFKGLTPQHFRIAAQTPQQNQLLIDALTQWMTH